MKKGRLNYRFHNPNTAGASANYILKILIEANKGKVEQMIQKSMISGENPEKSHVSGIVNYDLPNRD